MKSLFEENRILKLEESFDKMSSKQTSIIYDDKIYDAYSILIDILNSAKEEIIIIDNYANKDLSDFNSSMISVKSAGPSVIANELKNLCDKYSEKVEIKNENPEYIENSHVFDFINDIIKNLD